MQATKVSDLLPISDDDKQPHAYQVFGLEGGEQDSQKVKDAILATVKRLKEQKPYSDPKVWKKAAKLVQQAETILSDPARRGELDAMFGIVQVSQEPTSSLASPSMSSPEYDPLAAMLPSSDPLADILPAVNPISSPAANPISSLSPIVPASSEVPMPSVPMPVAGPVSGGNHISIKGVAPRRRRRAKTNWFLVLSTLGLFAIVGMLAYFVFLGPGELAITSKDGQLTIRKGAAPTIDDQVVAAKGQSQSESHGRDDFDQVLRQSLTRGIETSTSESANDDLATMGREEPEPNSGLPPKLQKLLDEKPAEEIPEMTMPSPETKEVPETPSNMQEANEDPAVMMTVEPPMESGTVEMTHEMVQATDQQIEQLRELMRGAKWKQMTQAASDLKEAVLTEDQRKEVDSLYELADLATYYYGAIERGILSRQAAETIKVTDALTIAIVEVGPDLLVIRYAGRNKTFKFDELPLTISHRMAEFILPTDKETNLAAKACFQSLAPKSTSEYRKESIDWLVSIDGEVPGADPKKLAETIKQLFR